MWNRKLGRKADHRKALLSVMSLALTMKIYSTQ